MRVCFWAMVGVGCMGAGCAGNDKTGCPLEPTEAIGSACSNEGQQCSESSLCDPCTSDLSQCEAIACVSGQWQAVDVPTECTEERG